MKTAIISYVAWWRNRFAFKHAITIKSFRAVTIVYLHSLIIETESVFSTISAIA
jgi:hypothetical protein